MDQHTSKCIGENGHIQESWSNEIRQKIVQLYFQLVRSKNHTELKSEFHKILGYFVGKEVQYNVEFKLIIKMIANVRDITNGKGEQQLSFMMLFVLWDYYPEIAKFIFIKYLSMGKDEHCLGSYKDVKYLCNYIKDQSKNVNHPFIEYILYVCVDILRSEEQKFKRDESNSLFCKWFPREKSKKFGWINRKFAKMYYSYIMSTANNFNKNFKAERKCYTKLRKLLANINRKIDTTQIKMTGKNWKLIDFNKVTGPTIRKHKLAFQNKTSQNQTRYNDTDRVICTENFKNSNSS